MAYSTKAQEHRDRAVARPVAQPRPLLKIVRGKELVDDATTKTVNVSEFSRMLGLGERTVRSRIENVTYTHMFMDGDTIAVKAKTEKYTPHFGGKAQRIEFSVDDAMRLNARMKEKGKELVTLSEIAEGIDFSDDWIAQRFREHGKRVEDIWTLDIGTEKTPKTVNLRYAKNGKEKSAKAQRYMTREDYTAFEEWAGTIQKKQNWKTGAKKCEVPAGYVTTVEAGRIIGFSGEANEAVVNRIKSGKIAAITLEDGRRAISLEEVKRYKEEREKAGPKEGQVKVYPYFMKAGMTENEVRNRLKKREDGEYFVEKDETGAEVKIKVTRDADNTPWMYDEDGKTIVTAISNKETMLVEKTDVAMMLGISENGVDNRTDSERKVVCYRLPNGEICEIHIIFEKRRNRYVKRDVEDLVRKRNELEASRRGAEETKMRELSGLIKELSAREKITDMQMARLHITPDLESTGPDERLAANQTAMGIDAANTLLDSIRHIPLAQIDKIKAAAVVTIRNFAMGLDLRIEGKPAWKLLDRLGQEKFMQIIERAMEE